MLCLHSTSRLDLLLASLQTRTPLHELIVLALFRLNAVLVLLLLALLHIGPLRHRVMSIIVSNQLAVPTETRQACGMVVVGWLGRASTTLHCTHHVLTHRLKDLNLFLFPEFVAARDVLARLLCLSPPGVWLGRATLDSCHKDSGSPCL